MVLFWSAMSVVVIVVPSAVLAVWGWRRRIRRQNAIEALPTAPAALAGATGHAGKYVATTTAGDPYDRIAARGLAFRGFATVAVADSGLLVDRVGEVPVWIERYRLIGVDRATWTIDRVVEARGLHVVRWRLGDRELDTYLRLDDPAALDDDLRTLGLPLGPLPFPPSKAAQRRAARRARREASLAPFDSASPPSTRPSASLRTSRSGTREILE